MFMPWMREHALDRADTLPSLARMSGKFCRLFVVYYRIAQIFRLNLFVLEAAGPTIPGEAVEAEGIFLQLLGVVNIARV